MVSRPAALRGGDMTALDIDALERAAQEATRVSNGRWRVEEPDEVEGYAIVGPRDGCRRFGVKGEWAVAKSGSPDLWDDPAFAKADADIAAYIAAANPAAILSLIAEVRELTRQRDEARADRQKLRDALRPFVVAHMAIDGRPAHEKQGEQMQRVQNAITALTASAMLDDPSALPPPAGSETEQE